MAKSSPVTGGVDKILASQYNDLRSDVLDPVSGHVHDGVDGKKIPPTSISPQGSGSGLDADTVRGYAPASGDASATELVTGADSRLVSTYSGATRTINIATTDDAQTVMDAANHYIAPGETVNIVLADGTHTRTSPLYIRGWYGGGKLVITSAAGDATLHTTQPVILDFSGGNCDGIVIDECSVSSITMQDVKVVVDTSSQHNKAIRVADKSYLIVTGCYVQGTSTSYGTGISVEAGQATIMLTYADNVDFGIRADKPATVWAYNNDDTGTTPQYGGYANGGTLHRAGTVISGSIADAASGAGGTYT